MSDQEIVELLEQIRNQQKAILETQHEGLEDSRKAVRNQEESIALQKKFLLPLRLTLIFPWVLVVVLLFLLLER